MNIRKRRWWWIAASLVTLYGIAGFLVLPPLVRGQAEKRLSAMLGRRVTIERVRLNPFALSATIEGFDIRTADGKESFLGWKRLYANFEALASMAGSWVLGDVELDGFHAAVAVNPDGTMSVADILAKVAPPAKVPAAPATPSRPIRVDRLQVTGAQAEFTDLSRRSPFHTTVGPMDFRLTDFRTAAGPDAPYHFSATTEKAEKLAWQGTLGVAPLQSNGELRLEGIDLPKYAPYFEDRLHGRLASGRLTVGARYEAKLDGAARRMRLSDGAVELRDVRLLQADGQPAIELPSIKAAGISADALALKATIAGVTVEGGRINVRRAWDGTLNLLALLAPVETAGAPAAPPGQALRVEVSEVAVDHVGVAVRDETAAHPAELALEDIRARVRQFTLAPGAKIPVELSLDWRPRGTVKVAGAVSLAPLGADVQVEVGALALAPLSPYLEQTVNARLAQGSVSVQGRATLAMSANGGPAIGFAGDAGVDALGLVDAAQAGELVGFAALSVNGIKAETAAALKASIGEIRVTAPYARARVGADGALNLAAVLAAKPAKAPPAPTPAASSTAVPMPEINVGRIVVEQGDFSFEDASVQPGVAVAVKDFATTLSNVSSLQPGRGEVELQAKVSGVSAFKIAGRLDPLAANPRADLTMETRGVDLLPVSPYVGKYAGYELARGKLSVAVTAKLADRKLDSENVITLDQFTFGAATNSAEATHLPVRLGVALLKDTAGQIVIDVPVKGSLDDPNFKIGRVVLRVIVNLLTKAATSPFALLGSMFGGGGDELGLQEFLPGETTITPESERRLATVERALAARPGLNLELEGGYDRTADSHVLRRAKIRAEVRHRIWLERHAQNPDLPPPEKMEISSEAFAAGLQKLFDEKFPPGTTFGTPLPAEPELLPPPAPARRGLFRRTIDAVTFKETREKRAFAKVRAEALKEHEADVAKAIAAGLPVDEMLGRLAEATEISEDDLQSLASARAACVRERLITEGKMADARIFLARSDPARAAKIGARVELHLQ
ncbi:MAG TPA: DUF748 domain-containing protein [Opitutus sp.]|nr:DUF748 domain-containing protein [Opitutus sp.]